MTTEIRVRSAPDLLVANEVMNIRGVHLPECSTLAGASWSILSIGSFRYDALLSVFQFVHNVIIKRLPGYNIWLLIGDSTWQPDTRIIRYYRLWGGLKARGVEILPASRSHEVLHESEGKLKFFGATQLSELSIGPAVKALLEERCSYVAALPNNLGIEYILETGWSGDLVEDSSVISFVAKNGGLLLRRLGGFDDEERGLVAVGQPELVRILLD